jgi:hypothetical protein
LSFIECAFLDCGSFGDFNDRLLQKSVGAIKRGEERLDLAADSFVGARLLEEFCAFVRLVPQSPVKNFLYLIPAFVSHWHSPG